MACLIYLMSNPLQTLCLAAVNVYLLLELVATHPYMAKDLGDKMELIQVGSYWYKRYNALTIVYIYML